MANKDANFAESLEEFKKLPAATQKKGFDTMLESIKADSSDKEIASTIKEVIYWSILFFFFLFF